MFRNTWPIALLLSLLALWIYTRTRPSDLPAPHPHRENIVSLGQDQYHVEVVFDRKGNLKIYTLGPDETRVIDVETQTLTAHVREEGAAESLTMTLQPHPQPDDRPGRVSCFTGLLPSELAGKRLAVSIPSLRIEGQRFRVAFASPAAGHDPQMPKGASTEEEAELYLTPAGRYTQADIEANGPVPPSQHFRAFRATHDFQPRPGDPLCPVTRTKANPSCSWIIDGQRYTFCCPPCIDEFVRLAREKPEEIQPPSAYIQP